jgi:hypothetical protein
MVSPFKLIDAIDKGELRAVSEGGGNSLRTTKDWVLEWKRVYA